MEGHEARARFADARVARLATTDRDGRPHLVPITFALVDDLIYSAVDDKPKRTTALRRLANVAANPLVAVLVDHYDDSHWESLWWVRADGRATVLDPSSLAGSVAIDALVTRYSQYRVARPIGPVLAIEVSRFTGWSARA